MQVISHTHAWKMCSAGISVFVSDKISYCSYVHHFIYDAVLGSVLKKTYQTIRIFTLEYVESLCTQSSVWKFMLHLQSSILSYISDSFLGLLIDHKFFSSPLTKQ